MRVTLWLQRSKARSLWTCCRTMLQSGRDIDMRLRKGRTVQRAFERRTMQTPSQLPETHFVAQLRA